MLISSRCDDSVALTCQRTCCYSADTEYKALKSGRYLYKKKTTLPLFYYLVLPWFSKQRGRYVSFLQQIATCACSVFIFFHIYCFLSSLLPLSHCGSVIGPLTGKGLNIDVTEHYWCVFLREAGCFLEHGSRGWFHRAKNVFTFSLENTWVNMHSLFW